jgi:rod shape determining protein RodA
MRKNNFIISDWIFFLLVICILGFSLIVMYSATYKMIDMGFAADYWIKQSVWMSIGLIFMVIIANIDYRNIGYLTYLLYSINLFLLFLVLSIGKKVSGARRWISISGFTLQPSEFMKITTILALAWYLHRTQNQKWGLKKFFVSGLITMAPMILILKEPDLGTTLVFVAIYFSIIFISGAPLKYLFTLIIGAIVSSPVAWMFLKEYQKKRLFIFLNPYDDQFGAGWPIIQSKIAIGSGKLFGKGWLKGTQTQLDFLPEHHTDFIFSVLGEEWGFIGGAVLIVLFFLLLARAVNIAYSSRDEFGALLITGIVAMIFFQVIVNIGMTFGLMPITGLPLPLVSYGGSSILTSMVSLGLILSVRKRS